MKVSFFETGRYVSPPGTPREWPVPSGAYDPELGAKAYSTMIDRIGKEVTAREGTVMSGAMPRPSPVKRDGFNPSSARPLS